MRRLLWVLVVGTVCYLAMMLGRAPVEVDAGVPRDVPPIDDTLLRNFLKSLSDHLNTLQCATTNPNGTVLGKKGDLRCALISGCYNICINTADGPNAGTSWSCFCPSATCPGGSDTFVQYNDNSTCGGDEGFTFTESSNLVNINEATDGDSVLLLLANDQANIAGSTNETSQFRFGFGTDTDVARIVVGKEGAYTGAGANSSFMAFYTDEVGTATEEVRIQSGGDVGIGVDAPTNKLEVNGNMSIGNSYIEGTGAPTDGLIVSGQVGLGTDGSGTASQPTILGDVTIGPRPISGQADLYLRAGTGNNSQLYFTDSADNDIVSIAEVPHATSPKLHFEFDQPRNGYYVFHTEDNDSTNTISDESHGIVVGSGTSSATTYGNRLIYLPSGTTITNERYNIFMAPDFRGVAGGAAETITTAATVYISNAPLGTDITFTNGPYALWVDDGAVRIDGTLTVGNIDTGGGIGLELAAGQWTPTTNNIANFGSSSAAEGQYIRVGSVVTGSVQLTVDPTLSATATELELDLPVASNFGATSDAAGSCGGSDVASEVAEIRADVTSDELEVVWITTSLANHEISCSFSYQVI